MTPTLPRGRAWSLVTKVDPLPETYRPRDLQRWDPERSVRDLVRRDLSAMLDACSRRHGEIHVVSAFRSFARQRAVFASFVATEISRGVDREEAERRANRYSARPGHSEHQLGTTVDVSIPALDYRLDSDFADTPDGRWLLANAHHYGFVFSYPLGKEHLTGYVYEPWHLRWLGTEQSEAVYTRGYLDPDSDLTVAAFLRALRNEKSAGM